MKVLVTGGAGYIGSTTCRALELAGHVPVVLDSLVSGPRTFVGDRAFYEGDVADRALLERVVADHPDLDATIHMAARVVVPESVAQPSLYYRENVSKSLDLLDGLAALDKPRVLLSSSASVYAYVPSFEVDEDSPVDPQSPYARTKLVMEMVMQDLAAAGGIRAVILRYFNPIGADPELRTGIHVRNPSHVLGQLVRAATGQQDWFTITGTSHPTRDGTGLRDYIHVWDLALAHVAAVEQFDATLEKVGAPSVVLNVGTGDGVTVRELVTAFERASGQTVPVREAPAREGDAIGAYANVDRIRDLLGWQARSSTEEAIRSALAWSERRPGVLGYE